MLALKKIAVTGGLSCGKSSVCQIFKDLGAYVVSADEVVHQILSPKTVLGRRVIALLGDDIIGIDGIDRSKVANKVFQDANLLKKLEALLHPAVREEIERQYCMISESKSVPAFIAEIPLLYETEVERYFKYTVAVLASIEICERRFIETTGYGAEEFKKRMERQMPPEEKAKRANFVIVNNGSLEDLKNAVKIIYENLVNQL